MNLSDLDQYDYELPPHLIRKEPLEPRDGARLFIYDIEKNEVSLDIFRNLAQYLPRESLMVLNDTRVCPSRLWLRKPTGGKIEVFVLVNEWDDSDSIPALVDRKVMVGDRLSFPNGDGLVAEKQEEGKFFFRLDSHQRLMDLLDEFGETPIPHYLKSKISPGESVLRERYQTIFAAHGASVAAPTASLHFTDTVFRSLGSKGVEHITITLNVGLGTFAPLSLSSFETGRLHKEFVSVSRKAATGLNTAKKSGKKIIAVGTTVARTLETVAQEGKCVSWHGPIETFIYPPYRFQVIDTLITNFHLPKTSLLLLVDAFLQSRGAKRRVMDLYRVALEENFSFYSFGDCMLIR